MGPKSSLGWILLIAVLAVPAVLFWNWWTKMQSSARFEAGRRPPASAAAFPASSAPAPAAGKGASASAPPQAAAAAPERGGSLSAMPASASTAAPGASGAGQVAGASSPPASFSMLRPKVEYAPAVTRDPMLSQIDLAMIAAEESAREANRRQVIRRVRPSREPREGVENKLELQGVVATSNGMMALVSGESLREGDQIFGCVIVRITTRFVTFKSGSRTFSKRVE